MFPTLSKIYEIVLLHRKEKFAYFSNLQFGFQEVGSLPEGFLCHFKID